MTMLLVVGWGNDTAWLPVMMMCMVFSYSYTGALHQSKKKQILFIFYINRGVNRNDIVHSSTSAVLNILQLRTSIYSHLKERLNKYCLTLTRNIRHVPKWKYNEHMSFFCLHCNHRRMTMKRKYKIEMGCLCLRQDPSEESIFDHMYLAQTYRFPFLMWK